MSHSYYELCSPSHGGAPCGHDENSFHHGACEHVTTLSLFCGAKQREYLVRTVPRTSAAFTFYPRSEIPMGKDIFPTSHDGIIPSCRKNVLITSSLVGSSSPDTGIDHATDFLMTLILWSITHLNFMLFRCELMSSG